MYITLIFFMRLKAKQLAVKIYLSRFACCLAGLELTLNEKRGVFIKTTFTQSDEKRTSFQSSF